MSQICESPVNRAMRGTENPRECVEREGGGPRGEPGVHQHGPADRTAKERRKGHKWEVVPEAKGRCIREGGEHEI